MIKLFVGSGPGLDQYELALKRSLDEIGEEFEIEVLREYPSHIVPFVIPELCKFKGRVLYIDVKSIVIGRLSELYNQLPDDQAWVPALGLRHEVALFNCEHFNWHWWISIQWMLENDWTEPEYVQYLFEHKRAAFGRWADWHSHNGDAFSERTKILVYKDLRSAPKQFIDIVDRYCAGNERD